MFSGNEKNACLVLLTYFCLFVSYFLTHLKAKFMEIVFFLFKNQVKTQPPSNEKRKINLEQPSILKILLGLDRDNDKILLRAGLPLYMYFSIRQKFNHTCLMFTHVRGNVYVYKCQSHDYSETNRNVNLLLNSHSQSQRQCLCVGWGGSCWRPHLLGT